MEVMPFGMRLIILWAVGNIPITAAAVLMITERIGPGIFRRMERKTGVPGMVMERVTKDMLVRKGMIRVNGNFQRNGTGRQDTNHQNTELALYLPTNGIKVKGILKTVFGGILTGTFGIATMVVGGIGAGFSSSVMLEFRLFWRHLRSAEVFFLDRAAAVLPV